MGDVTEENVVQLAEELKRNQQEVKEKYSKIESEYDAVKGRMDKGDKVTEEMKHDLDELLTKYNGLQTLVSDMEQTLVRNPVTPQAKQTLGDYLLKSEKFKSIDKLTSGDRVCIDINTKEMGSGGDGQFDSSAGALVQPHYTNVVQLPNQRLTVRDLLAPGHTDSGSIIIPREETFDNQAQVVLEGGVKPESNINYTSESISVATVAHYIKASRQILDDASALRSMIDGRLRYGLKLKEENKLLNGQGGSDITGLIPNATPFQNTTSLAEYSVIDQLRLAMAQVVLSNYSASGHVLHPTQWTEIETAKDSIGRYIIGDPKGQVQPMMWGLPVIATPSMAEGQFLTGAFRMGAQIFDRWDMNILVSFSDRDDFTRNMITILCEERLALAIYHKKAFVTGVLRNSNPNPAAARKEAAKTK